MSNKDYEIVKISLPEVKEFLKAVRVTGSTMVGVSTKTFPVEHGNCFDVETKCGKEFRILNFAFENLKELIRLEKVSWPIDIAVVGKEIAIVCDTRIPDEWYPVEFCSVCTPQRLLSLPQRLSIHLSEVRGERETRKFADGMSMTCFNLR